VHEVSPTAWIGKGYGFRFQARINTGDKEYFLGVITNQVTNFHYQSPTSHRSLAQFTAYPDERIPVLMKVQKGGICRDS